MKIICRLRCLDPVLLKKHLFFIMIIKLDIYNSGADINKEKVVTVRAKTSSIWQLSHRRVCLFCSKILHNDILWSVVTDVSAAIMNF